jgi:transposase
MATNPHQQPAAAKMLIAAGTSRRWSSAASRLPACSPTAQARPRSPAPWASQPRRPAVGMPAGSRAGLGRCAPARQGRPPKLTPVQLRQLERVLLKGARGQGFDEELWTLRRVAEVIWRLAGVRYHPGHVWRILRGLGWSVQRPVRVAAERDEQAIARWVAEDWPAIKQTPTRAKPGSASWTSPRFR